MEIRTRKYLIAGCIFILFAIGVNALTMIQFQDSSGAKVFYGILGVLWIGIAIRFFGEVFIEKKKTRRGE